LNERDKVRIKHDPPRGILHVRAGDLGIGDLARYFPSAALAPFVEHYWVVRWDVDEPRVAETVPHPSIHVVLGPASDAEVVGVMRTKFSRVLEGRGRVVGTKFRPGAFRAFIDRPVSCLTDERLAATDVFGARVAALATAVLREADDRDAIAVVEAFLREFAPVENDAMRLTASIAARIADDRRVTRVDQLVAEFHTGARRLQRLFRDYVGVGPKWVIQRYRLLDAAERLAAGRIVDWAALALDLGYSDQAHFIRDFKKLIGRTPADYARSLA
jgi:AraC-like DNA-binding protein